MPINFHPKRGTVLMCDFDGFRTPEMVKRRHVVVISPRYRRHTGLCSVVPFSTVAPHDIEEHHVEMVAGKYDLFDAHRSCWAKGDMITTVCFERPDRLVLYGRYAAPQLKPQDLVTIQRAVAKALRLDSQGEVG